MTIRHAYDDVRFMHRLFPAAELEAQALGDEVVGPEHLLLSALAMRADPSARRALERLGVTADHVREAVVQVHSDALESVGVAPTTAATAGPARPVGGVYRSTGGAQEVFQRAVALAHAGARTSLRTAHVVLAIAEREHGTVARALRLLGADREQIADAARAQLDGLTQDR